MSLWSRIWNVFRGDAVNHDLDEEMASHLEEAAARGRTVSARTLLQRERSRDVKMLPWLDSLRADVVFGWRQLKKNRTVSVAAVLSLALGIGACTAAFRLIDALLWRPLPVADPHGLYSIGHTTFDMATGKQDFNDGFDYPRLRDFRRAAGDRADLILVGYPSRQDVTFDADSGVERAYRQYLSGNAFPAFGLTPALGRLFTAADDLKPGGHPVAVLSYDFWARRFGRDPGVIGRTFRLGTQVYEIIGVCKEGFTGTEPGAIADFFLPSMMNTEALNSPGWEWFRVLARLKPGVSPDQLRGPLQVEFLNLRREQMKHWHATVPKEQRERFLTDQIVVQSTPTGSSATQKNYRQPLLILGFVALLVLLISCANIANLLTAQAASRAREMALRVSIGAGRRRLVQLVLVESALLAAAATIVGALFAWWSAPVVVSMINPPDNPVRLAMPADWRLLGFAAAVAMGVTALFGIAPALRASAIKPVSALKGGNHPHQRRRWMNVLVASQVAFCVLVHFGTGLFISTFERLSHQPTGFVAERLLALEARTGAGAKQVETWQQIADELRAVPGVESVAHANWPLMSGSRWRGGIRVGGRVHEGINPYFLSVSPGFFETMKIGWIDGRDFRREEILGDAQPGVAVNLNPGPAIVNEEFARQFFNGENPVGKSFERFSGKDSVIAHPIVGYVRNARYWDMREPIRPTAYLPFESKRVGTAFLVRTAAANPLTVAPQLRQEVSRQRKEFHVINVATQSELVRRHTIRERLLATLSLFFAIVALVLAGVGLYGVLSYSVIRRTREIGIRMALGARPANVVRSVTAEVLAMIAIGSLIGLGAGVAAERLVAPLLFGVKATDSAMLAIPSLTLLAAAMCAALAPALRAVRIDPTQALRAE